MSQKSRTMRKNLTAKLMAKTSAKLLLEQQQPKIQSIIETNEEDDEDYEAKKKEDEVKKEKEKEKEEEEDIDPLEYIEIMKKEEEKRKEEERKDILRYLEEMILTPEEILENERKREQEEIDKMLEEGEEVTSTSSGENKVVNKVKKQKGSAAKIKYLLKKIEEKEKQDKEDRLNHLTKRGRSIEDELKEQVELTKGETVNVNLGEMDERTKKRAMLRLQTARTKISKMSFGQGLLKRAGNLMAQNAKTDQEKAKILEFNKEIDKVNVLGDEATVTTEKEVTQQPKKKIDWKNLLKKK